MTKTSFTIKWQPPENDGGTPVTEYIIEMKEESKKAWQKVDKNVIELKVLNNESCIMLIIIWCLQVGSTKHEVTHFSVSDLKTDTPYNFRITAKNSVGTGPPYVAEEPIAPGRRISKQIKIIIFKSTIVIA